MTDDDAARTKSEQAPEPGNSAAGGAQAGTGGPGTSGEPRPSGSGKEEQDGIVREGFTRNSFRVGPNVDEELYYSVTSTGATVIGDHSSAANAQIYIGTDDKPGPQAGLITGLDDLQRVYAPAPSDRDLDELLGQRHVVCLTGAPGTGRFTTARVLLARRHGEDSIREIFLPARVDPESLCADKTVPVEGAGHILRLPGGDGARLARLLEERFRQRKASLVLIRDLNAHRATEAGAEVRHERPDPADVFERHLCHLLRRVDGAECRDACGADGCRSRYVRDCLGMSNLRKALADQYRPADIVAIAATVARHLPTDEQAMQRSLATTPPQLRSRAISILLPGEAADRLRHQRIGQYERAFRIAYAVFLHQPLRYVLNATGLLLGLIDEEARRPDLGRPALEHPVDELLGDVLRQDWNDGRSGDPGASRRVHLRNSAMRGAILSVAWHEFDNSRSALLRWLGRLAQDGDATARRASAEIAGLLAHHEFEQVYEELIDGWAQSPRPSVREAAALATAVADRGGEVGTQVREKVREWVHNGTNRQRDTAVLVYAGGMHQPHLGWELADLRRIAKDRMQRHNQVIAEAIYQLYQPAAAGAIVAELSRWRTVVPAGRHAVRAWLALAERPASDGISPEMLARLNSGDVDPRHVAALWRSALLSRERPPKGRPESSRAWDLFGEWMHRADAAPALRASMLELLRRLAVTPALYQRLCFYLPRIFANAGRLPDWLDTV
ncbi:MULTISPECIES: hypothetical protein [Catenuloplanes]|uniref:Uncharacterized protein n=1 Tax=Catenuloplanes niger TaxID=587534 RepID=A0AAE3ZX32_9ACTN|nr:hypothetical protein [Catenuloplanes niger]MDR7326451.1 hypothetical protein [Catenuloplanes niger]